LKQPKSPKTSVNINKIMLTSLIDNGLLAMILKK